MRRLPIIASLFSLLATGLSIAAPHQVSVISAAGDPVTGAVVFLNPLDHEPAVAPRAGVMDQIDRQFEPHILVVQQGAEVGFPNSDSIKHHVFSFSKAKTFEIRLYGGEPVAPLLFDRAGEVELGCNVHDWMLGYIYVVDTPYFSRTDGQGAALIEAPSGRYELGVWHPRITDDSESLLVEVSGEQISHRLILNKPLLPPFEPTAASDDDEYD